VYVGENRLGFTSDSFIGLVGCLVITSSVVSSVVRRADGADAVDDLTAEPYRDMFKGDPCNMDHLRICLQIIVKVQLASGNYTPSCRAPQSTFRTHLHSG